MRIAALTLLLFFMSEVFAQPPTIARLYDQQSQVPNALIPLMIVDATNDAELKDVRVTSPATSACRVMVDRFYEKIFFLKCTVEANVRFEVSVKSGNKIYKINYGPLEVKKAFAGTEVVDPTDPVISPTVLAGRQLFQTYCIACHSNPLAKAHRTAGQIQNAFDYPDPSNPTIYPMQSLKTLLTPAELVKIETYLGTL